MTTIQKEPLQNLLLSIADVLSESPTVRDQLAEFIEHIKNDQGEQHTHSADELEGDVLLEDVEDVEPVRDFVEEMQQADESSESLSRIHSFCSQESLEEIQVEIDQINLQIQELEEQRQESVPVDELISQLDIGSAAVVEQDDQEIVERYANQTTSSECDFEMIAESSLLKAESARWQVKRARLFQDDSYPKDAIKEQDQSFISRAKEFENCFLAMPNDHDDPLRHEEDYQVLAACYATFGKGCLLAHDVLSLPDASVSKDDLQQVIQLLAECQSALRVAVENVDTTMGFDADQKAVFFWLQNFTDSEHIYLPRYMKLSDPATPANWRNLQDLIAQTSHKFEALREEVREKEKLVTKLANHCSKLVENPAKNGTFHVPHMIDKIDALVEAGEKVSSRTIREHFLPVYDLVFNRQLELPDDLPTNVQLVMAATDTYLNSLHDDDEAEPEYNASPTPEVAALHELIGGRSLVFIGGDKRNHAYENIKQAFDLKELYWPDTTSHTSLERFQPLVSKTDVDVVLVALNFASHSYSGPEMQKMCADEGKLLVRLTAGYSPNQIAHRVMSQVGNALREKRKMSS